MAFKIGYVSSWQTRLLGRIYEQHKGLPNFDKLVRNVLAPQAQDLEDALQSLLTLSSIDDSEGVNLDVIGRIVVEPRAGFDDPTYRKLLRTRIRANASDGLADDIYDVFSLLFDSPEMSLMQGGIASFSLLIDTPITALEASLGVGFLGDAKLAGVRAILEWQEQPDDETFTFAQAGFLLTALVGGETELDVADADELEPAGEVTINLGLADEEVLTYTSIVDERYLQLSSPVALAHAVHSEVEQTTPMSPGLGFGDLADPTVGGAFADAAQAA